MPTSAIRDNYRRGINAENNSSSFGKRYVVEQLEKQNRPCCAVQSSCRKRLVPWASLMALLVTWSGLFLFCSKVYFGLLDMEVLAGGYFEAAVHYLRIVREVVVLLGVVVASSTGAMLIIGFFATLRVDRCFHGRCSSCVCDMIGSRLLCGLFWIFGYLFNLCWLLILTLLVLATSAYFCFLPICLPQTGTIGMYCFNFTLIASAISGGGASGPSSVSLILCGTVIDKFCKLTKAISVWSWGAYGGCLAVLVGLFHFNGSLAANFAHVKHAFQYRRIRRHTKANIEWTKDWRVKSITLLDYDSSGIFTVSDAVTSKKRFGGGMNRYFQNQDQYGDVTCDYSDSTVGTCMEEQDLRRLIRNGSNHPPTTSNGSIVLHKRLTGNGFLYNAANARRSPVEPNCSYVHRKELIV